MEEQMADINSALDDLFRKYGLTEGRYELSRVTPIGGSFHHVNGTLFLDARLVCDVICDSDRVFIDAKRLKDIVKFIIEYKIS